MPASPSRPLLGPNGCWLDDVPNPYPLWVAVTSVLIMTGPNLIALAAGAVGGATIELSTAELVFALGVTLIFQVALFGAALLPLLVKRRLDRRLLGPTPTSWRIVGLGVLAGIATIIIAYAINAALALLLDVQEPVEQELLRNALEGGVPLVMTAVIAVVTAPLVEEVVFRGVLFRALMDRMGVWLAALLSAAIFAVIHVEVLLSQPVALAGLFVVGAVLALAYQWTGNLWVPIIGHAVFNGFSLTLTIVVDRLGLQDLLDPAVLTPLSWSLGALAG